MKIWELALDKEGKHRIAINPRMVKYVSEHAFDEGSCFVGIGDNSYQVDRPYQEVVDEWLKYWGDE